ncbi:metallopeptidase TldD-related protein [Micromonospora sp. WMMD1102]|uniref:TldD/PmbA family protein n=1 Tax=Micromonospora sp. WMMD1102 TaxID=3016105 RepID=UPI0024152FA4|nr:metallopeptidase TldD-related protein [Micromonospora sp. WMMD1102]MDG4784591.1 metallopeptidase TldD-related protein [Micromonospora sp. WMMD1102]
MTSPLDLAGRVVELVRQVAGPGAEAEVGVEHAELALTRFANSFIHQNLADVATTVRLRLHLDGRTATAVSTVVGDEGVRGLVERTVAAVRHCPPDPGWPGLVPPGAVDGSGNWDEATATAGPEQRAERVRDFVDAVGGLEAAGYCRTGRREGAFANTAGHSATGRHTEAMMDGIARCGGADGVARVGSVRLADLHGGVLGARASVKARAGVAPVELPPGRYEVVLEPSAVVDLLQNLAMYGFNGKAYNEQRSFAVPGAEQFDRSVTLLDDALASPALPFDAEGTGRTPVALVEQGVTRTVSHDRRTAAEAGSGSTGHAVPGGAAMGAIPLHLGLVPAPTTEGAATPGEVSGPAEVSGPVVDTDTAALVTQVRRGLLVTDFWYTRVLEPKSLVVTGLTRNGVWLVEDGEVTAAVQNFRFTQSYPQALAPGAVLGIGRYASLQSQTFSNAWWSAPPLRLASWNFTGGASG